MRSRAFLACAATLCVAAAVPAAALRPPTAVVAAGRTETRTLVSSGLLRHYRLFVPGPPPARGWPLVVVLHGTYGTGEKMEKGLGFDEHARARGFLVAYPDAYREPGRRQTARWNDGRGVLESSRLGVDDVLFLGEMISAISAAHAVDARRIFVTGASNGGMMTYRLGCELRGRLRAIAPVIGNVAEPLAATCSPEPGLSILSINGDLDPFVPLTGGEVCRGVSRRFCEGGTVLSRDVSLGYFARAAGCLGRPASSRRDSGSPDRTWVERLDYPACDSGAVVRSLVVHGMGHSWPPRAPQATRAGPSSSRLDATAEIVGFFMSF